MGGKGHFAGSCVIAQVEDYAVTFKDWVPHNMLAHTYTLLYSFFVKGKSSDSGCETQVQDICHYCPDLELGTVNNSLCPLEFCPLPRFDQEYCLLLRAEW